MQKTLNGHALYNLYTQFSCDNEVIYFLEISSNLCLYLELICCFPDNFLKKEKKLLSQDIIQDLEITNTCDWPIISRYFRHTRCVYYRLQQGIHLFQPVSDWRYILCSLKYTPAALTLLRWMMLLDWFNIPCYRFIRVKYVIISLKFVMLRLKKIICE